MTPDDLKLEKTAFEFARKNKNAIAKRLTDKNIYLPEDAPVSVFMSGSPGAGKTESSKYLINRFSDDQNHILRIDPDELRVEFKDYDGSNSYVFQKGVSILVEKIHDLALKNSQSFLLDGTLSKYDKAKQNITRSLNKNRAVQILYVYQDPILAWKFVLAREKVEGRRILIDDFIAQYFGARDVVNQLKSHFKKSIEVDLLLKNNDNSNRVYKGNIDCIDNHIPEKYTPASLEKALKLP